LELGAEVDTWLTKSKDPLYFKSTNQARLACSFRIAMVDEVCSN